jgi:hypothetical protein
MVLFRLIFKAYGLLNSIANIRQVLDKEWAMVKRIVQRPILN